MQIGEQFNPYRLFVGLFIPNALARCPNISAGAKLCYGRLAQYAGENGEAYPSYETLAKELGVTRRSAIKYAQELEMHLLIRIISRKNVGTNDYTSNVFRFLWHGLLEDSLTNKGGEKDSLPLVKTLHYPSENFSPKENHLRESNERDLNTVENHDCDCSNNFLFELETAIKDIGNVELVATGDVIMGDKHLGHLANESKRKASIKEKFKEKEIPALIQNWERGRVIYEKIGKGGVKTKTSPQNSNGIITLYGELFKEHFGGTPPLELGKDRALIKKMIDHYGFDYVKEMFIWTFKNWGVFVREKKIKGLPTIGVVFGFRSYIQSKVLSVVESDNESEW